MNASERYAIIRCIVIQREISEGFITLEGGNRVGISGTAVLNGNYVETLKYINGINFRISGQVFGCSEKYVKDYMM